LYSGDVFRRCIQETIVFSPLPPPTPSLPFILVEVSATGSLRNTGRFQSFFGRFIDVSATITPKVINNLLACSISLRNRVEKAAHSPSGHWTAAEQAGRPRHSPNRSNLFIMVPTAAQSRVDSPMSYPVQAKIIAVCQTAGICHPPGRSGARL